jgi:uncharacterized Zn-binding protein involved in type VI secretion
VGGPVTAGDGTVLIGFQPAARVGDAASCKGPSDTIAVGERSVQIGFRAAARLGDATSHGGVVVAGCPTVIIGSSPQAETLRTDKPFAEDCEEAARHERVSSEGGA